MTEMLLEVAADCCDGRLAFIHEGGYSEAYVPFCGVAVLETLLGEQLVEDPFLAYLAERPGQELQPHQDAAVERAAALIERIPA
jgi:acetoin utilization deacetylase AcuC-like enzyme